MPAVKLKTILTFFILHEKLNVLFEIFFVLHVIMYTLYVGIMASVQTPQSSSVYIKSHLKCSSETINLCNRFYKINGKISFSPSKFHSFYIFRHSHLGKLSFSVFKWISNEKLLYVFLLSFDDNNNNINATDYVVCGFWKYYYHLQLFNVLSMLKENENDCDKDKWHSILYFDIQKN